MPLEETASQEDTKATVELSDQTVLDKLEATTTSVLHQPPHATFNDAVHSRFACSLPEMINHDQDWWLQEVTIPEAQQNKQDNARGSILADSSQTTSSQGQDWGGQEVVALGAQPDNQDDKVNIILTSSLPEMISHDQD